MGEITTKKTTAKRYKWNSTVVRKVAEDIGVTEYFVRQSLRGDRLSNTSDKIKKEYDRLCKVQEEAFTNALK
jgi:hypothetical protein